MTEILEQAVTLLIEIAVNGLWVTASVCAIIWLLIRFAAYDKRINSATTYGILLASFTLVVAFHLGYGVVHIERTESAVTNFVTETEYNVQPEIQSDLKPDPEASTLAFEVLPAAVPETDILPAKVDKRQIPVVLANDRSTIAIAFAVFWVIVSLALLTRIAISVLNSFRIRRTATRIPELENIISDWQRGSNLSRSVFVASHPSVRVPYVVGLLHPTILLPPALEFEFGELELKQILRHELAHIKRFDDWTLIIQRITEALLFFNPGVRWLGAKLDEYRELACDDSVLAKTPQPLSYAASLGRIAQQQYWRRSKNMSPAMASRQSTLVERIRRIVENTQSVSDKVDTEKLLAAVGIVSLVVACVTIAIPSLSITIDSASTDTIPVATVSTDDNLIPPSPPLPPTTIAGFPPIAPIAPAANLIEGDIQTLRVADRNLVRLRSSFLADPPAAPLTLSIPRPVPPPIATIKNKTLSVTSWRSLLATISKIASDSDKRKVLADASSKMPDEASVYTAFIAAASSINSSSDLRYVLESLATRSGSTDNLPWTDLIEATKSFHSDSDRANVLTMIFRKMPRTSTNRSTLLDAAHEIRSSSTRAKLLQRIAG